MPGAGSAIHCSNFSFYRYLIHKARRREPEVRSFVNECINRSLLRSSDFRLQTNKYFVIAFHLHWNMNVFYGSTMVLPW